MCYHIQNFKVMNMEKAKIKTNFTPFAVMPLALVCEATKLSEDELYNLVHDGKFPNLYILNRISLSGVARK